MMKRPWSISTTIRNPNRIMLLLETLKHIEGKLWNTELQTKFQILLIQEKKYIPTKLTDVEMKKFKTSDDITFSEAKKIFERQEYTDPPMRGRTSLSPLKQMCLCTGSSVEPITITDSGEDMIKGSKSNSELFFNYFLKWELPNPIDKGGEGMCVKPFLATLSLINTVNKLCSKQGKNPTGLTNDEFALFVPTLINYNDIDSQAKKVLEYRKHKNNSEHIKYKENFAAEFLGVKNTDKAVKKLLKNLKDYGDNIRRYFRLTKYVYIRGNGNRIDLEPRRKIEIEQLLNSDIVLPEKFSKEDDYIIHVNDITKPKMPWENIETLEKINLNLTDEISKSIQKLKDLKIDVPNPPKKSGIDLKKYNDDLRQYLFKLQNVKTHNEMSYNSQIIDCIYSLNNIHKSKIKNSINLEKQIALAFIALNDSKSIHPNYPVGDDGEPTFTAPAGVADLECFYEKFNMVCEVTMLTNRQQWVNEGQPVMRHFRDFAINHMNLDSYCMFIAPSIHVDTAETFWYSIKSGYRGKRQKIIPITISTFVKLLYILIEYKTKNNRVIPHQELLKLYEKLIDLSNNVQDSQDWIKHKIPVAIDAWGAKIIC